MGDTAQVLHIPLHFFPAGLSGTPQREEELCVCTGALLRLQVQFPTELGEAALGLHKAAAGQPLHEREDTKSRCSDQTSASHSDLPSRTSLSDSPSLSLL